MKRKRKKRRIAFPLLVIITGLFFIPWAMKPENFREQKNQIYAFLSSGFLKDSYNAKSLILLDRSNDSVFISKNENEQQIPASLSKLFVIEYAAEISDLDSIVTARQEAIALTKPGSSVAGIKPKDYFLHNLFAAMLIPSGNDAAYVVADYCGGLLSPQAGTSRERVEIFMKSLNGHLEKNGYQGTVLQDPSGFDLHALTTVKDLKLVLDRLLEYSWFRDIIAQSSYTTALPDGSTQTWKNTNAFLDPVSEYYNENVIGSVHTAGQVAERRQQVKSAVLSCHIPLTAAAQVVEQ